MRPFAKLFPFQPENQMISRWSVLRYCLVFGFVVFANELAAADPKAKPIKQLILPGESFFVAERPAFVLLPPESKRTKP
jgi:hypothetical protein